MMQVRNHKFVDEYGEAYCFELSDMEAAINSIWKNSVDDLPYQLVDELSEGLILRFARHMPEELVEEFEDEVDLDQVIAWAIVAECEKTEWTIYWVLPILLNNGPSELFWWEVRLTAEDMRLIR